MRFVILMREDMAMLEFQKRGIAVEGRQML